MTKAFHLVLFCSLLLVTGVVAAQSTIYRCMMPDGVTIFSDSPCIDESSEQSTQDQLKIPESRNILESRPKFDERSRTQGTIDQLPSQDTPPRGYHPGHSGFSFSDLLDGYIVAQDGTYLGNISTSTVNSKSILNSVGAHGSKVRSDSIFNSVGRYGSGVSRYSAFNDIASSPPRVYTRDGKFVGYLTTNKIRSPRIEPYSLIGWLRSQ